MSKQALGSQVSMCATVAICDRSGPVYLGKVSKITKSTIKVNYRDHTGLCTKTFIEDKESRAFVSIDFKGVIFFLYFFKDMPYIFTD